MNLLKAVDIVKKNKSIRKNLEEVIQSFGIHTDIDDFLKQLVEGNKIDNKFDVIFSVMNKNFKDGIPMTNVLSMDNFTKKKFSEVFTPTSLVDPMLDKLPEHVWSNPEYKWIDNSCGTGVFIWHGIIPRLKKGLRPFFKTEAEMNKHIASMIYGCDLQEGNVAITRRYVLESLGRENIKTILRNFVVEDSLNFDYWKGTKFNVVVGNPPYENGNGKKGRGSLLWTKFVELAINKLLLEDGYLCYVHPAGWRQLSNPTGTLLKNKQMNYLEIHSEVDGAKTFGSKVNTRYDWYVLKNAKNVNHITEILDQDGATFKTNLKDWDFVPNCLFDDVQKLLATKKDTKVDLFYSSMFHHTKLSANKDSAHAHPCIYSIGKSSNLKLMWSKSPSAKKVKDFNKAFGTKKFIFQLGFDTGNIVDNNGEYGVTQWCAAIVDSEENLVNIKKAFDSKKFKDVVIKATSFRREINANVLKLFRKDFWKEFVNDNQTVSQ